MCHWKLQLELYALVYNFPFPLRIPQWVLLLDAVVGPTCQ
jgi:hypothetical protein